MADKSVNIRLSLKDGDVVKRALLSLGEEGQRALKRITSAAPEVSRGLKVIDASVKELKGSVSNWAAEAGAGGRVLAAFGPWGLAAAAGVGVAFAAFKGAKKAADDFDNLADSADRLGVSIEGLQALRFAGSQLGVDIGDVDGALAKLGQTLGDVARGGNKEAAAAFDRLGFSATNADGTIKTIEEALPGLADGFAKVGESVTQLSLAQDIFGKGGAKFVTALTGGADALQEQIDKARELGAVVDENLVRKGAEAKDELDALSLVIGSQLNAALIDLAPIIVAVAQGLADAAHFAGSLAQAFRDVEDQSTEHLKERVKILEHNIELQEKMQQMDTGGLFAGLAAKIAEDKAELAKIQERIQGRSDDNLAESLEKRAQRRVAADAERDYQAQQKAATDAQKAADKAAADAQRDLNRLMQEGQSIYKETRTAAETYAETVSHLSELLKAGAINQDTYGRAVADARETYQKQIDTLSETGKAFKSIFDAAGNAIEDFAATGKLNLEQLGQDVRRILAQMAVEYLKSALFKMLFPTQAPGLLAPAAAIAPSIVGGPGAGLSSAFVPALARAITPASYTSGPVSPIAGAGGTNQAAIWSFFKSKGLTDAQTAGIMGNIFAESGYSSNPPGYNDAGNAYGLFQHNGQRMQSLFNAAGTTSPSMQQQLDFAWSEIQRNPNYQGILKAGSVDEATRIFGKQFEAPANLEASINKRIAEANRVLEQNAQQMTRASDTMTENLTAIADGTQKAGQEFGNKFSSGLSNILNGVGSSGSGFGGGSFFGSLFNSSFSSFLGPIGRPHGYYARGDVFDRPHIFPMAKGWGLMAEAGPEAVMPLRRNRRGDLGVILAGAGNDNRGSGGAIMNVQVNNYADVGVETRQTQGPDGPNLEIILNRKIDSRIGRTVPDINEVGYGQQRRLKLR